MSFHGTNILEEANVVAGYLLGGQIKIKVSSLKLFIVKLGQDDINL